MITEREEKESRIEEIVSKTGLSRYFLSAFYDFYGHRLPSLGEEEKNRKPTERLVMIVCPNKDLVRFGKNQSENEINTLLRESEKPLARQVSQGKMTPLEKDTQMIQKFLGFAQTSNGHFVMVHFHGENNSQRERENPSHWSILHKKYLPHFHTRFTKERNSLPFSLSYSDIEETVKDGGHLSLDIRYLLHRWNKSSESEKHRVLLSESRQLFERGPGYLNRIFERSQK